MLVHHCVPLRHDCSPPCSSPATTVHIHAPIHVRGCHGQGARPRQHVLGCRASESEDAGAGTTVGGSADTGGSEAVPAWALALPRRAGVRPPVRGPLQAGAWPRLAARPCRCVLGCWASGSEPPSQAGAPPGVGARPL